MTSNQTDALSREQLLALVGCMLSTAEVDGVQPQEVALIQKFYVASATPGLPAFDEVRATASGQSAALLKQVAADTGFTEQLVLMCLMTGYADGHLTDAEHAHVQGIAQQVGIAGPRLAELQQQVKDSLLGALSHLPDAASVAALAREL
jgi:uncharacterized tellurite resistance protein B-like protein